MKNKEENMINNSYNNKNRRLMNKNIKIRNNKET